MSHPSRSTTLHSPTTACTQSKRPHEPGSTHINLFLTNLRLLDLDLRQDWPNITISTFSTRNVLQDQKKRIEAVEWALYNLFLIWDRKDTQDKLQPFFPPLKPLQSLNLRQALYRCLENVKKNGILGRDVVLRRTMLDECKGERLEEVLAAFSTAVLKKVVGENSTGLQPIALRLALENLTYKDERLTSKMLTLAHKASLGTFLKRKKELKQRYEDFAGQLASKEEDIQRRTELLRLDEAEVQSEELSNDEAQRLHDVTNKNWSGSDDFKNIIINGEIDPPDMASPSDLFNGNGRARIDSTASKVSMRKPLDLLEELNTRLEEQKQWLKTWRKLEKTADFESNSAPHESRKTARKVADVELAFDRHHGLQLSVRNESTSKYDLSAKYLEFVEALRTDLAAVTVSKATNHAHKESPLSNAHSSPHGLLIPTSTSISLPITAMDSQYSSEQDRDTADASVVEQDPNGDIAHADETIENTSPFATIRQIDRDDVKDPETDESFIADTIEQEVEEPHLSETDLAATPNLAGTFSPTSVSSQFSPIKLQTLRESLYSNKAKHPRESPSPVFPMDPPAVEMSSPIDTMSSTSHKRVPPRPHFPRQSSAPFLPDSEGIPTSPESDLTHRTRLSIANLSAMTKNAEVQRKSSVRRAELASDRAVRAQFMPKKMGMLYEQEDEQDGNRLDTAIALDIESELNPFLSRPKVSND